MTDKKPSLHEIVLARQADAQARGVLNIWTVYDHPTDYPNEFVARRFETGPKGSFATSDVMSCPELRLIRGTFLRCGLVCMTRSRDDDPKIMETWM